MRMWIIIILVGILTQLFRIAGEFIPLPRNKFMDKFLEAIPISVLVILFFPNIFISIGTSIYEVVLSIFASIIIAYMTFKKVDLGKIMLSSIVIVIVLNLILTKIFS